MATTTINNPRMSFEYYYLDNSHSRTTHYAETLQEAAIEAKKMTNGRRIVINNRYGGFGSVAAIVEPDGTVNDRHGNPLRLIDRHGNTI